MKKLLFVPDTHAPDHDEDAFQLMLRAARRFRPDIIVILGDFADCRSVGTHSKDPRKLLNLRAELDVVEEKLDQLEKLGASQLEYIEGNHENRLDRYIADQAQALSGLVSYAEAVRLHERGWRFTKYRKSRRIGKLHVTHDTGTAGMNAHRQSAAAFGGSAVIGHTHRISYEVRGRFEGAPYVAAMFGWLGGAEAGAYMHEAKASEWALGFGIGYMEDTGIVHLQPVPIVNGKCVIEGQLVK